MAKQVSMVQSNPAIPHKYKATVNTKQVLNLLRIVNQIYSYNNAVPLLTGKWLSKNHEALQSKYEKFALEEKELKEGYNEYFDYVSKTEDGKNIFWDGVEGDAGVKAFVQLVNEQGKELQKLINISNGQALTGDILDKMVPYVSDPEKRKVYNEKQTEFQDELKKFYDKTEDIQLYKIGEEYLTQTRFVVPTTMATQNGQQQLPLSVLYDFLIEEQKENSNGKEN